MAQYIDQLGRTISLDKKPRRIISLVPSQSEYLWDLGLQQELIAVSKFCVHPKELFEKAERVGGTKNLNLDKIRKLKPDLIIGNKEENEKEQIEILAKEFPVWMSDIYNFKDAFEMMKALGEITGKQGVAEQLISASRTSAEKSKNLFEGKTAAYFIWNEPYLFAGKQSFIHEVLEHAGFINVLAHKARYPEMTLNELKLLRPEFCLLSSEPFPFEEKHRALIQKQLPESKVLFVDGEMFSWYGPRMIYLYDYLVKLKKEFHA